MRTKTNENKCENAETMRSNEKQVPKLKEMMRAGPHEFLALYSHVVFSACFASRVFVLLFVPFVDKLILRTESSWFCQGVPT